ncbi:MAG: ATP-binding cassette domain-containing protein [Candidatus Heimdallarchaeota archaeon]
MGSSYNEILSVEGMSKTFGRIGSPHSVLALDNITFTMKSGANSILGPNGAGKSTLIKIMLGFIHQTSGTGQLLGYDIRKEGMKIRELVGYVPEHYALIPGVNAIKQVSLLARISGLPKTEAMQRSHETLQYVGLGEARYRRVDEFSTGMLQRLKLAQSLVNDPELIILDEPTNGLDLTGRLDMIDLIREISRDNDINIIVCSHLLPDIEATCEFTTILDRGEVVAQGKISELMLEETQKREQRRMIVMIKGDYNEFLIAFKAYKLQSQVIEGLIHIPFFGEDISQTLIKIAYETKVQIRSMVEQKAELEDVFVHTITDKHQESKEGKNPKGED